MIFPVPYSNTRKSPVPAKAGCPVMGREGGDVCFFSCSAAAFSLLKGIGILKGDDSRAIITLAVSFGYG